MAGARAAVGKVQDEPGMSGCQQVRNCFKKNDRPTLAEWLRWLEHRPVYQKVTGLIPGQGTYLGCGFDP